MKEPHLDAIGRRRPARQPVFDADNISPILFLTVCTAGRRRILADAEIHGILRGAWKMAEHWSVGRYVILPDHIHLFCAPATQAITPVKKWVQYWKALVARAWPRPDEQPIWQVDAWDTQLRKGESYSDKWAYVRENPVRHGLVRSPDDWPYQGEMNVLEWHDR